MRFLQNITFYKFEESGVMMMTTTACSVIDRGIGLNNKKKRLVNCNHNTTKKQLNTVNKIKLAFKFPFFSFPFSNYFNIGSLK